MQQLVKSNLDKYLPVRILQRSKSNNTKSLTQEKQRAKLFRNYDFKTNPYQRFYSKKIKPQQNQNHNIVFDKKCNIKLNHIQNVRFIKSMSIENIKQNIKEQLNSIKIKQKNLKLQIKQQKKKDKAQQKKQPFFKVFRKKIINKQKLSNQQIKIEKQTFDKSIMSLRESICNKTPQMQFQSNKFFSQKQLTTENVDNDELLISNQKQKSKINEQIICCQVKNQLQKVRNLNDQFSDQKPQLFTSSKNSQNISQIQIIEQSKLRLKKFKFLTEPIKGQYWQVFTVMDKQINCLFNLRSINRKLVIDEGVAENVINSIIIRYKLSSINVSKIYEVFKENQNIYIIEQFIYTDLKYSLIANENDVKQLQLKLKSNFELITMDKILQIKHRINEKKVYSILKQLLETINELSKEKIILKDLSLNNICLSFGNIVKIVNSDWITRIQIDSNKTFIGNLLYATPQFLIEKKYDEITDIWGLGVTLYELVCGIKPFINKLEKKNINQNVFEKIKNKQLNMPIFLSKELIQLLDGMITPMEKRMTIQQIENSIWIKNNINIDQQLIQCDIWRYWVIMN